MKAIQVLRNCLAPLTGLVLILFMSGCDSASNTMVDNIIIPQAAEIQFCFRFEADSISISRLVDIPSDNSSSIDDYLAANGGFSRSDIVSAGIIESSVIMLQPVTEHLDFLDKTILKIDTSDLSELEVADHDAFPADREVALQIRPNRDIASYLQRSSFDSILQLDANRLTSGESYEVAVLLKIQVEVAGF